MNNMPTTYNPIIGPATNIIVTPVPSGVITAPKIIIITEKFKDIELSALLSSLNSMSDEVMVQNNDASDINIGSGNDIGNFNDTTEDNFDSHTDANIAVNNNENRSIT